MLNSVWIRNNLLLKCSHNVQKRIFPVMYSYSGRCFLDRDLMWHLKKHVFNMFSVTDERL